LAIEGFNARKLTLPASAGASSACFRPQLKLHPAITRMEALEITEETAG
jgi:hypothetical protein